MQPPLYWSVSPLWSFCTTASGPHGEASGPHGVTPKPFFAMLRETVIRRGVIRTRPAMVADAAQLPDGMRADRCANLRTLSQPEAAKRPVEGSRR
jgi:hypothetical protein